MRYLAGVVTLRRRFYWAVVLWSSVSGCAPAFSRSQADSVRITVTESSRATFTRVASPIGSVITGSSAAASDSSVTAALRRAPERERWQERSREARVARFVIITAIVGLVVFAGLVVLAQSQ